MDRVLISVIIPVYNAEAFLVQCLESLLAQNIEGMELVLVNDGSKDNSLSICQDYHYKYPDIVRLFSQENKGQSAARNLALSKARGEYIAFVDSDDALGEDTLKSVLEAFDQYPECDMVQIPLLLNAGHQSERYTLPYVGNISKDGMLDAFAVEEAITWRVCDKVFRHSLLYDLNFVEGMVYEDNLYMCEVLLRSKGIVCLDKGLYRYNWNGESTTKSPSPQSFIDMLQVHGLILQNLQRVKASSSACTAIAYIVANDVRANMRMHQKRTEITELGRGILATHSLLTTLLATKVSLRRRLSLLYTQWLLWYRYR